MHERQARAMTASDWASAVKPYRKADAHRALFELAVTFPPFAALWTAMMFAMRHGLVWMSLALAPLAAALLVRMFMIQHDCGHGAFLPGKLANDWLGRAIGVLTLTPYDYWRRSHAIHHATSGNLDRRGIGEIKVMTVREYRALTWSRRFLYRLYRHPLVLFGIGPSFTFLIESRLPSGATNKGAMPWLSTMSTNAGAAIAAGLLIWWAGLVPFLAVHLPIVVIAATAGVWLFYVQHQFETTSWDRETDWNRADGALAGSSHYDLPPPLKWFSANIGVHHVHHLSSGIPFYRLPEVLHDHPELRDMGRLTLWRSFGCIRLALWDEDRRRLVSFRDESASQRAAERVS